MRTREIRFLLAIIVFCSINTFGQTIELSYTGEEEVSNYVQLDSIFIRNNTKGIDTMLLGGDTTLFLNLITAIRDNPQKIKSFELQQNYPNPFRDRTTFAISVFQREELNILLFNIYGQKLTELKGTFEKGTHLYSLTGSQSKFYLLKVTGQSHSASIKLVNSQPTGGYKHNIVYTGNQPIETYYKVTMSKNGFPYSLGDELLFVGYAEGYEFSVLKDSPENSTDYTFKFEFFDTFECGETFTDERDGQLYQTIKIDRQCWMKVNMNIGEMIPGNIEQQDDDTFEKYCYEDDEDNCEEFGGLYQWDEMMQYDTVSSRQGICPKGWHLPTIDEWNTLINFYGGSSVAGESLKLGGISGFDALMAGERIIGGEFVGLNNETSFWTSNYQDNELSYYQSLTQAGTGVSTESIEKQYGHSVRCIKGLSIIADSNIVIIDTTVYTLISDSLELTQGIYKYEYTDKKKVDEINTGDIIIGNTDEGYLRKVNTVSDEPPFLTLETTQATMEDVFVQGDFSTPFNLDSLQQTEKSFNKGKIIYIRDGLSLEVKESGFKYFFEDVEIFDNGNISLFINDGFVFFYPEFEFDFKFDEGVVRRLEFYSDEATLDQHIVVQLNAQYSGSIDEEIILAQYQHIMGFLIGAIPVWVTIDLDLIAETYCIVDEEFEFNCNYSNSNLISVGIDYKNGEWNEIWELQHDNYLNSISWDGAANLEQRLALIPSISIRFYGIEGTYLNVELWEQLVTNYEITTLDTDATMDLGLDANLGAEETIFGYTLSDYYKHIPGYELNTWNMPDELQMVSGNNQTAQVNQQLPESILVKVIDNHGNAFSGIPVHFEVAEGGGSLSNEDVLTTASGYAWTYWTLGPDPGENIITARVVKADGTDINGSPLEFTATAGPLVGAPIADFYADPTNGSAPLTVYFTDQSTYIPTSWEWDFGDGGTSIEQNPYHNYEDEGVYTVQLTATNSYGSDTVLKIGHINVTGVACPGMTTVTDIDGNEYNTVLIGDQCWMQKNLKTTTYNNGTPIPHVGGNVPWYSLITGAYDWYNTSSYTDEYGALYNWLATVDTNGLCPTGWHVPTNDEWIVLTDFIGGTSSPHGNLLKSCRQENSPMGEGCNTSEHPRWDESMSANGTNDYGFSGLPGGYRDGSGWCFSQGEVGCWWSLTEYSSGYAWSRRLVLYYGNVHVDYTSKHTGLPVRCLKD